MSVDDLVQPFQIDASGLRGRLVRLGPLLDAILTRHAYPEPVAVLLGEAIALAVALAGALKYEGVFTLQTKGDGPIGLMVADVTTAGAVRGYAQYDEARLERRAAAEASGSALQLGAAASRRGLSRVHRRSGRAYRSLPGHRRAAGRDAGRVRRTTISASRSRSRPA